MIKNFELLNEKYSIYNVVGTLKFFASEENPAPLNEQIDKVYCGGWNPLREFTMKDNCLIYPDMKNNCLIYPDDPPLSPLAKATFRDQTIYVYMHGWVAIVEKDGSFEASRID
jgi:hypothetical protein